MSTKHLLLPLMTLVLASHGSAQESVGTLRGTVRDASGKAIVGAQVTVSAPTLLVPRNVRVNKEGEYRFSMLPPGNYEVVVAASDFLSFKASLYMGVGQTLRQDAVLKAQAVAYTEVEVVAQSSSVDKTESKTATNVSADVLQALPMGSVDAYSALAVAPGVTGNTGYPQIRGSVAGQSSFTVNGINAKDAFYRQGRQFELVLNDMIQDIQVIQSAMNARYGNTGGGIVNVVTKTGTNTFEGSLRVNLDSSSWNGLYGSRLNRTRTALYTAGSDVSNDALSRTFEVTLSGPIVKDRLTFSYGTRLTPKTRENYTFFNPVVPNNWTGIPLEGVTVSRYGVDADGNSMKVSRASDSDFHDLKLFWNIGERQNLEMIFSRSGWKGLSAGGNIVEPNANIQQRWTNVVKGANYRALIGDSGLLDIRAGTRDVDIWQASGPGVPIRTRVWYSGVLDNMKELMASGNSQSHAYYWSAYYGWSPAQAMLGGSWGPPGAEKKNTRDVVGNFTWTSAAHSVDMGVSHVDTQYIYPQSWGPTNTVYYSPGMTSTGQFIAFNWYKSALFNSLASYRSQMAGWIGYAAERYRVMTSGNPDELGKARSQSLWLNDQFTVSDHWIIMGGLRYNRWRLSDRTGPRITSGGWEPRLEVKCDLHGDGKRLLSATYGVFSSSMQLGDIGSSLRLPGNIVQRSFWNTGTEAFYLVDRKDLYNDANYKPYSYTDTDQERSVNPNLRPSSREEATLNYRRAFDGGGSLRVTAVYSRVKDQYYYRGINETVSLPQQFGGVDYAVTPTIYRRVLDFDPYAKRVHRGFEFEFDLPLYRKDQHSLSLGGNWTINRDHGRNTFREGSDGDPTTRFDDLFQSKGIGMDVYNPDGEIGASIHNVVKAWLTWTVRAASGTSNTVTLYGSYASGAPYSMTNSYLIPFMADFAPGKATSGFMNQFPVYYGGTRGNFYTPETYSADLQWNMDIPLVRKLRLRSYLTINNLFNSHLPESMAFYGYDKTDLAYNNGQNLSYRSTTKAEDMQKFGMMNLGYTRGVSLAVGLKF